MAIMILFLLASLVCAVFYFRGDNKFSPLFLILGLWSLAIAIAQLRLSPYENVWPIQMWLALGLFFAVFALIFLLTDKIFKKRLSTRSEIALNQNVFGWLIVVLSLAAGAANIYIFSRFGTLPILSTIPDKMRFIINREVFGLWEYTALLPRLLIPAAFIYLLHRPNKWGKGAAIFSIISGFLILFGFASRATVIFSVLVCYFSYLMLRLKNITAKKMIYASVIAVSVVLVVAVAIPAFRQYITYRDYYSDVDYNPFTYLADLSQIRLPDSLKFLIPLYLIPAFNLQEISRATGFFQQFYHGAYQLTVFNPGLKIFHLSVANIVIPWKEIFLPWWVTGTFLFGYFADGSYIGLALGAIFWGAILAGVWRLALARPSIFSALLFAYASFIAIMSIYTNYFMRPELYLDLVLIILLGWAAQIGFAKSQKISYNTK